MRICLLLMCAIVANGVLAQPADAQSDSDIALQRQQIAEIRSRETARFDAADAVCRTRFAVNDCLRGSQTQRRAVLSDLRKQEAVLNERERVQRGLEQNARAAQKAQEQSDREKEVAEAHTQRIAEQKQKQDEQTQKRIANKNIALQSPAKSPSDAKKPAGPEAAQQSANRSDFERRQAQAQQRKLELEKRNAEKTGKPATALPVPQ